VAALQGSVLLIPAFHLYASTAHEHLLIFGVVSAFALVAMTFYINSNISGKPVVST